MKLELLVPATKIQRDGGSITVRWAGHLADLVNEIVSSRSSLGRDRYCAIGRVKRNALNRSRYQGYLNSCRGCSKAIQGVVNEHICDDRAACF